MGRVRGVTARDPHVTLLVATLLHRVLEPVLELNSDADPVHQQDSTALPMEDVDGTGFKPYLQLF